MHTHTQEYTCRIARKDTSSCLNSISLRYDPHFPYPLKISKVPFLLFPPGCNFHYQKLRRFLRQERFKFHRACDHTVNGQNAASTTASEITLDNCNNQGCTHDASPSFSDEQTHACIICNCLCKDKDVGVWLSKTIEEVGKPWNTPFKSDTDAFENKIS